MNTEAVLLPDAENQGSVDIADARGGAPFLSKGFAPALGQTTPTPANLPQVGPSRGLVIGATVGATAAFAILPYAYARHRADGTDYVVFENGWQFAMVLSTPLTLDALRLKEAASLPAPR